MAKEEQQALLDKQEHERQREAHTLAANAPTLNDEIDKLLTQLREACERRTEKLHKLAALRVVDANYQPHAGQGRTHPRHASLRNPSLRGRHGGCTDLSFGTHTTVGGIVPPAAAALDVTDSRLFDHVFRAGLNYKFW